MVFDYILQYNLHADNMVARHLVARIGSTQFLQKISHSGRRFKKIEMFWMFWRDELTTTAFTTASPRWLARLVWLRTSVAGGEGAHSGSN